MLINNIEDIVLDVAPKYPCIDGIGIFGSYARGDYNEDSDIDILYDYDTRAEDSTDQILDFVESFLEKINPLKADFVFLENILTKDDDFKKNALNNVRWLYRKNGFEGLSSENLKSIELARQEIKNGEFVSLDDI